VLYLLQDPSQLLIEQNVTSDTCIRQHWVFWIWNSCWCVTTEV